MPLRELWMSIHGRSSRERWRRVLVQVFLCAGVVGVLCVEFYLLRRGADWLESSAETGIVIVDRPVATVINKASAL